MCGKAHVALLCYYVTLCYYVALLQQIHFCFGVQAGVTDVHRFPKGIAWQSLPTSLDLILLPLSPFISTKVKTDVRISFRSESSSLPSASHHHHHHHHHLSPMPSASQLQHQFFSNLRWKDFNTMWKDLNQLQFGWTPMSVYRTKSFSHSQTFLGFGFLVWCCYCVCWFPWICFVPGGYPGYPG